MITHDPNRVENPTRADSTSIDIGPRAAIDLFYWTDAAGKLNAVIDPRHGFEVPMHTKRTSFSVGAIMEMMLRAISKNQEAHAAGGRKLQEALVPVLLTFGPTFSSADAIQDRLDQLADLVMLPDPEFKSAQATA